MKRRLVLSVLSIVAALGAPVFPADLVSGPDFSFLWNQFNSIEILDEYALVTTDFGLAVLELDSAHGYFSEANRIVLDNQANDISVAGNIATVSTSAGILYFVDISELPNLVLSGQTDLGSAVHDAVLVGDDLYLACGFDGLRHFSVGPNGDLEFVDSSLAPIHCIQVETQAEYLVVLDDYNGLLRYVPSVTGIRQVESRVKVPRRAESFFQRGDSLVLPLANNQWVYLATFEGWPGVVDSAHFSITPERVFAIDSFLVAVAGQQNQLEIMSLVSGVSMVVDPPTHLALSVIGDTFHYQGYANLVLGSDSLGLAAFNLNDIWLNELWYNQQPRQFYNRPGPVSAVAFHKGWLLTGGLHNPLESYNLTVPLEAVPDTALLTHTRVNAVADGGEVAFVYLSATNQLQTLRLTDSSATVVSSTAPSSRPVNGIKYFDYPVNDTASLILSIGLRSVDVIPVSEDWRFLTKRTANPVGDEIGDATVIDSFLVVSTLDRQIHVFRIFPNFGTVVLWWQASTDGSLDHLTHCSRRHAPDGSWREGIGLGFDGNQMYEVMIRTHDGYPRTRRIGSLPIEIATSAMTFDALYGVGPLGITVLDIRQNDPIVTAYGGFGGSMLALQDSIVAVSDGSAIHLYSFSDGVLTPSEEPVTIAAENFLRPNYPNPFNPRTRIDFMMPDPGRVEIAIFDVLGRRVTTLIDTELPSGLHSVNWDGTSSSGDRVASGIYFYRMSAPRTNESRKMVLLK